MMLIQVISLLLMLFTSSISAEDSWSYIVVADWHGAESFALYPDTSSPVYTRALDAFKYLKQSYDGDFLMLPGDSNSGKWDVQSFVKKMNPEYTPQQAVYQAGVNCYSTMKTLFSEAGYSTVLMSLGDHELGGNGWGSNGSKVASLLQYRDSFVSAFNKDPSTGSFLFKEPIGGAPAVPYGTPYEQTSYAHRHKNALMITIDAFHTVEGANNVFDRETAIGGEGIITCTVEGKHLDWFRNVLAEARSDASIKHIFVQAHLPVIQPVRKVKSSGQFMDYGTESDFWKTMEEFNVDIYFAGEVHANTVTKSPNSNVLQVVTRGNTLNNFVKVVVEEDVITLLSYNEVGPLEKYNHNHELQGTLTINKAGEGTDIVGTGILEPVDLDRYLIYFSFESIYDFNSRQVLGLKSDDSITASNIIIRDVTCTQSMYNQGEFGSQYDAQVSGITLTDGIWGNKAASFTKSSRFGVFATAPHSNGHPISYALWFKTTNANTEMILIHSGQSFGFEEGPKDIFTLTLKNGNPVLYRSSTSYLSPKWSKNLSDGQWHHVAISMPYKSCFFSEVEMYIDGNLAVTTSSGNDQRIFFNTSSALSLGGFGYSSAMYELLFPNMEPYTGDMDEFYLYGKPLEKKNLLVTMRKKFIHSKNRKCMSNTKFAKNLGRIPAWKCKVKCKMDATCFGFQAFNKWKANNKKMVICSLYSSRPKISPSNAGAFDCSVAI